MAYQNIGFDENLMRVESSAQPSQALDPLQFDNFTDSISADKIQGGLMVSPDGRAQFDLNKGTFLINNGVEDLVTFGTLPDGSVGLLIKDQEGNILLQISETNIFMQSSNEAMKLDFIQERLDIRDAQKRLKVRIGKDEGGF